MREPTPPSTWSRWHAPSNYTLAGIALLLAGALVNGSVAWMSVACGVIGVAKQ